MMRFAAYVVRKGMYVKNAPDVLELMLYNGRRILVRGCKHFSGVDVSPGDLVEIACEYNDVDKVDLERDQEPETFYRLYGAWTNRITNEDTVRTFFQGAKILNASAPRGKLLGMLDTLKAFLHRLFENMMPSFARVP